MYELYFHKGNAVTTREELLGYGVGSLAAINSKLNMIGCCKLFSTSLSVSPAGSRPPFPVVTVYSGIFLFCVGCRRQQ